MSKKETGGPAFPCDEIMQFDSQAGVSKFVSSMGMTLRDYFAAKAMTHLIPLRASHGTAWNDLADSAYEAADAMLEARKNG